jgi:hypothetical protein
VEVLGCEPEEEGEDCIVIINKEKLWFKNFKDNKREC